jgi:hypothetical protein
MKKIIFIGAILALVMCVMTQLCGISHASPPAGIRGSLHDLSVFWQTEEFDALGIDPTLHPLRYRTNVVCVFCHTPHGANTEVTSVAYWDGNNFNLGSGESVMLWNRALDNAPTNDILTYQSSSMTVPSPDTRGEVWTYSLLCLSCHDGVSALNVLNSNPYDTPPGPIQPDTGAPEPNQIGDTTLPGNIGDRNVDLVERITHLENDHPVSIDYVDSWNADQNGLVEATDPGDGKLYVGHEKIRLFPRPDNQFVRALECPTCHDVHNEGYRDAFGGLTFPFLAVTKAGSYLCTRCHIK